MTESKFGLTQNNISYPYMYRTAQTQLKPLLSLYVSEYNQDVECYLIVENTDIIYMINVAI